MYKKKLMRKAIPVFLSLAVMATAAPVSAFAGVADTTLEEAAGDNQETVEYVMMNIPYADFYKAEVNNEVDVDAFSSATKTKTRTGTLAGGSYHLSSEGDEITGITYPVKLTGDVDLSKFKRVYDTDSVEITTTNQGKTSTAIYNGKDSLFENESYAYYVLTEVPAYYKEATMTEDGKLSFGKAVGTVKTIQGASARLITETSYGDYQLNILGVDELDEANLTVNAVVISTKENKDYGLRHLENIWLKTQLAWSTGFTTAVHNCPTSSAHYKEIMGQTINKVTYYTTAGIYEIPLDEIYVPIKFAGTVKVDDTQVSQGKTNVSVEGLPETFAPVYKVSDLEGGKVENGVLTFSKTAAPGEYTLEVEDSTGTYMGLSTSFVVSTDTLPVSYTDVDKKLKAASQDQVQSYVKNITSVSVNGTDYASTGKRAVTIINEDGTIKRDAEPVAADGEYEIKVTASGYPELSFTYTTAEKNPSLTLNKKTAVLYTKGSTKVTLKATLKDLDETVSYKSSNTKVATVNAKGQVTAKKAGTATITATCGDYSATCKVTVKAPSLKLAKAKATVKKGKTVAIKATATPSGKITYKSSNKKVASVSAKGVVKGVKKGKATITVTCNGVTKKFTVTVK